MDHVLYDIWENETYNPPVRWRVQLINFVGGFPTQKEAADYVAAIKAYREKEGLK